MSLAAHFGLIATVVSAAALVILVAAFGAATGDLIVATPMMVAPIIATSLVLALLSPGGRPQTSGSRA